MALWIPRPVYEAIPYVYMLAGAALLVAAYVLEQGPRGWLLAGGAAGLTAGLVLWMRRRGYRVTRSEYDARSLDE
jgi:hypothetical protein